MLRVLRSTPPHAEGETKAPKLGQLLLVICIDGSNIWCEVVSKPELMLARTRKGHGVAGRVEPKQGPLLVG